MYLPKSKYEVKQAFWGMFKLSGSQDEGFYVGPYIEDYLGRVYAGTSLKELKIGFLSLWLNRKHLKYR